MTSRRFSIALVALAAAIAASAGIALAFAPSPGTYQGTVNGTGTHNEGEGYFRLTGAGRMVPIPTLLNIHAPTDFICKPGDPSASNLIRPKRIAVKGGAFDYKGTPALGPSSRTIHFKGHWTNASHLVGSTRTTGGGCNHVARWKMQTPPPP